MGFLHYLLLVWVFPWILWDRVHAVNQWKTIVPPELIEEQVRRYWAMDRSQKWILENIKDDFDTETYGLGRSTLAKYMKEWGLLGTRAQGHTPDSIAAAIQQLRQKHTAIGAPTLRKLLQTEFGIKVSIPKILAYLKTVEPAAVRARKSKRFRRKTFVAAGVNHFWTVDQHDKWKRFGLYLHIGLDAFSSKIIWIKIWWTNSNPRMVVKEYLSAARRIGGVPIFTQSDLGSENFGMANAQTSIRQRLDPRLAGTLQHRWMKGHNNIKPEIAWSHLRNTWAPGFEDLLAFGVESGWYDTVNSLHRLVFRWLAIPWLQRELDHYVYVRNISKRRADKNKILPIDPPDLVFDKPQNYETHDFKICVSEEIFHEIEQEWAPPNHPVFELVPPEFGIFISQKYAQLGSPIVSNETFWDVYLALLHICQDALEQQQDGMNDLLAAYAEAPEAGEDQGIPLMLNQKRYDIQHPPGDDPQAQVVDTTHGSGAETSDNTDDFDGDIALQVVFSDEDEDDDDGQELW